MCNLKIIRTLIKLIKFIKKILTIFYKLKVDLIQLLVYNNKRKGC